MKSRNVSFLGRALLHEASSVAQIHYQSIFIKRSAHFFEIEATWADAVI